MFQAAGAPRSKPPASSRAKGGSARPKLSVNTPGDAFELREADRLADEVMRRPGGTGSAVRRGAAVRAESLRPMPGVRHPLPDCSDHEDELRAKPENGHGQPETVPPIVHEVLGSPGRPLDPGARAFFEPRLGHDFARVRVHTDTRAAQSASAVQARAYAVGSNVVFAAGQYAPQSDAGRRLLAHELVHVVQQSKGSAAGLIQRACPVERRGLGAQAPAAACDPGDLLFVKGPRLKFCTDSDQLLDGQDGLFADWVVKAKAAASVKGLHGHASKEGPSADYNRNLSCHRASGHGGEARGGRRHGADEEGRARADRGVWRRSRKPERRAGHPGHGAEEARSAPDPPKPEPKPNRSPTEGDAQGHSEGQLPRGRPRKIRSTTAPNPDDQHQGMIAKAVADLDQSITLLSTRPLADPVKHALYIVLHKDDEAAADIILERLTRRSAPACPRPRSPATRRATS